jgi:hypothetical protein
MTFLWRFGAILLICNSFMAKSWAADWPNELLNLTGTSLVFDDATVQKQLSQTQTPDLNQLLTKSHYKAWAGARLWIVQFSEHQIKSYDVPATVTEQANQRGIILDNQLNNTDIPLLSQAIAQYQQNPQALNALLNKQHSDALLVISTQTPKTHWQIFGTSFHLNGTIDTEGLTYLPHIWAENLGMMWQWPELDDGILLRIENITQLEEFVAAENALQNACPQLKLLQTLGTQADFACLQASSYQYITNQLRLSPALVARPFSAQNLSAEVLIGQELTRRYLRYSWQNDAIREL